MPAFLALLPRYDATCCRWSEESPLITQLRKRSALTDSGLTTLAALRKGSDGSIVVEYGLIAALVAIALIVLLVQLRDSLLGLPFDSLIAAFQSVFSS